MDRCVKCAAQLTRVERSFGVLCVPCTAPDARVRNACMVAREYMRRRTERVAAVAEAERIMGI